jgi:IMP dehydrogenase
MLDASLKPLVNSYLEKKGIAISPAGTFNDYAIINLLSSIHSRGDIKHLKTKLSKNFELNIPIVSANMDTVTDAKFAIALARLGGLGFIHQFFSLEERVREVERVKRADNTIVDRPLTIRPSATLTEAYEIMNQYQASGLLVVDEENHLIGIMTSRDLRFVTDLNLQVADVMTKEGLITAPVGIENEEAIKLLQARKIEKLPLIDASGKVAGLITAKDILKREKFPLALRDRGGHLVVGAALRLNTDYMEEAQELLKAGTDVLLLDTARAGSTRVGEATKKIKEEFPESVLVVGNIDTPEEAEYLAQAGADCLKVGIGPGTACKTREETGVGIPQLYAIATCAAVAKKYDVGIIADGGIKNGGTFAKALVAGANAVMIGGLFAGTDEAPGFTFRKGNQLWKTFRGSASLEHQLDRLKTGSLDSVRNPEGESALIPYAGSLHSILDGLTGGLRSSMSYVGAATIEEYQQKGTFIQVTRNGYEEGRPQI